MAAVIVYANCDSSPIAAVRNPHLKLDVHRRWMLFQELVESHVFRVAQVFGRIRLQLAEQAHGVSIDLLRGKLIALRVEQPLVVGYAVAYAQDAVQAFLQLGAVGALRLSLVKAGTPDHGLAGAVGQVHPKTQREPRN